MNVSEDVISTLDAALCEGGTLALQGQLDRKHYVAVDKVLRAAGGKWDRKAKAHVFECDAEDAVTQIVLTGKVTDTKKEFDFFETPSAIATRVVGLADIQEGDLVLEPSAGRGALVGAINALGIPVKIHCREIQEGLTQALEEMGNVLCVSFGDFLAANPPAVQYDRIVMNPPFGNQADIHHVTKAIDWLKPGGRLVAIMSAGVTFRENKLTSDFRDLVVSHGDFIDLPEGSFKASGTGVNAVVLVLDKAAQQREIGVTKGEIELACKEITASLEMFPSVGVAMQITRDDFSEAFGDAPSSVTIGCVQIDRLRTRCEACGSWHD